MTADPLRSGGDRELEELELDLLLTAIARRYGYDFRQYAEASLKRRVRKAVQLEGVGSISGLQERLLHDLDALRRFISVLSVHVTAMFRDPPFHLKLREEVIPKLRTYPFVRVWIAGCATGEEVYSLAILLSEAGIYDRTRIYATDISDDLLERARRGVFGLDKMKGYEANYRRAGGRRHLSSYYAARGGEAHFDADLRKNVVFSQHNLAADGVFNEFQLILCRNVMIYFDQALRRHVHHLLYQSLGMFGVLGLGLRETIRFTPFQDRYEALDAHLRIYRRTR